MNKIEILSCLRHPNLVSLYGCTSGHCHELLLVYEYIPNGTIADHLHSNHAKPSSLSWTTRMSIAFKTASALAYLHASNVIHRNVKTNNILLNNSFCVKLTNFGLSRLFPNDVSTAPQGTLGYMDPQYHGCYQLTDKSDVYSFGVVLIYLTSSKPAVDITRHRHKINLSNMAINKIQNQELHELVDPCLGFNSDYKVTEMIKVVAELAFQCLQNESDMRPLMKEVLEVSKEISSVGYDRKVANEMDIPADDVVLLKSDPPTLSPNSLRQNWRQTARTRKRKERRWSQSAIAHHGVGVILLELLTRKPAMRQGTELAKWVLSNLVKQDKLDSILDFSVSRTSLAVRNQMLAVLKVARACVSISPQAQEGDMA
ncbi:LEAF RUST 10 DISEASE-RESISTANCE LOCUS RECEPTOR-LIKE PROTEIN KINASE-like 1.4 [Camellia lanceoleosa]|uniref:LEAF RUST 10 DISEASE-RESISTANCE LOCUS RECEPTOR-LIKE PROTEIN KINASE-like 1.4 n=1 Tax=Camellia lanceoleosa TaxID=1840588 RepID=A0ACC0FD44_9ERIC|nr:LEAF RUST 10 DISEASE-RESISTANCE LOCUS RECEPTOR-LIKE PROTEIN KINASE-like 1.4 [Camellia lanceoleosa]